MKLKVFLPTLIFIFFLMPSVALANFNEYGYNGNACIFNGTFENWENFVYALPPSHAVDSDSKDVVFLIRKWNKPFDDAMFHGETCVDGAWQQAHFYEYLSGDKLNWTWNWSFKMVYSSTPIKDALTVEGMENFYIVQNKMWLTDPEGNEIEDGALDAIPSSLGQDVITGNFHTVPPSLGPGFYKK